MNAIDRVLATARSEIGYIEKATNSQLRIRRQIPGATTGTSLPLSWMASA